MSAFEEPDLPQLSPRKTRTLVLVALAAALLGLTLLDVDPLPKLPRHAGIDPRSADCIVASAIFAGVGSPSSRP